MTKKYTKHIMTAGILALGVITWGCPAIGANYVACVVGIEKEDGSRECHWLEDDVVQAYLCYGSPGGTNDGSDYPNQGCCYDVAWEQVRRWAPYKKWDLFWKDHNGSLGTDCQTWEKQGKPKQ